jgi:radical SAM protein with 4Fe4S-binding SPASM domain
MVRENPGYFTARKLVNLALVQVQARYLRNRRVIGYPYWADMDPTSICNLRCPLCPTGQRDPSRSKGVMTFEHFKHLFDDISPYLVMLRLFSWGEPFLNKDLVKMIAYAHQSRVKTVVGTNFHFLDPQRARGLVEAGLDEIVLSIDGATQEVYEKYRVRGHLDTVLNNIKLLVATKREMGSKRPIIYWQYLVFKHNQHELPRALEMARELGCDRFVIGGVRVDMGKELLRPVEELLEANAEWLPDDPEYGRYDLKARRQRVEKDTCYLPWTSAAINWDGSVAPCSGVYQQKLDYGDASKEGLGQVWNNEKYQAARAMIARRREGALETVCHTCVKHKNYIRDRSFVIDLTRAEPQLAPRIGNRRPAEGAAITLGGSK